MQEFLNQQKNEVDTVSVGDASKVSDLRKESAYNDNIDNSKGTSNDYQSAPLVPAPEEPARAPSSAASLKLKGQGNIYHPICQAAAQKDIQLSISKMFHEFSGYCDPVSRLALNTGSCKVQVLRSVGKWSIGTDTEHSIWNCYSELISQSKRLIYIENQFFISSNAGDSVQNDISAVLEERIIKAYRNREPFRVIIIIPVHPNGDFLNAMKARVVMHYEYATINRGVHSMFARIRKAAPGINIEEYIGFFSLRNWGVINNKVVHEQIYVHDKLMIIDDDIIVVGSANINDRSLLGNRDSEVAVRIEDTLRLDTLMGGKAVEVGYLAHTLRLKLMRQHVADESIDFTDPLNPESYKIWRSIATRNSSVYDELDGNMSLYRCSYTTQYKEALGQYVHRSFLDSLTQQSLSEIKGFLVDWPQDLFKNDDLSPSMATRALIPNELWV